MSNSQGIRKSMSESKVIKLNKYLSRHQSSPHNVWWFIDS